MGTNGCGFRRIAAGVCRIGAVSVKGRCTPPCAISCPASERCVRVLSRRPQRSKLTLDDHFGRAAPAVVTIPEIP
jgi:hypothetical protein